MSEKVIPVGGTKQEGRKLNAALLRECDCKFDPIGRRKSTCSVHQAILDDPNSVSRLIFASRRAKNNPQGQ